LYVNADIHDVPGSQHDTTQFSAAPPSMSTGSNIHEHVLTSTSSGSHPRKQTILHLPAGGDTTSGLLTLSGQEFPIVEGSMATSWSEAFRRIEVTFAITACHASLKEDCNVQIKKSFYLD